MGVPRAGYMRTNIKGLLRQDKPIIVLARYYKKDDEDTFITFYDAHLYSSGCVMPQQLCHHITIFQSEILKLTGKYWNTKEHESGDTYMLVCRPYLYAGSKLSIVRGGLKLTSELGIGPIVLAKNQNKVVPQELYFDFRQVEASTIVSQGGFVKAPRKNDIPLGMRKHRKAKFLRCRKRIQARRKANKVLELIQYLEQSC